MKLIKKVLDQDRSHPDTPRFFYFPTNVLISNGNGARLQSWWLMELKFSRVDSTSTLDSEDLKSDDAIKNGDITPGEANTFK